MTITQLKTFLAILESGSFTEASKRLGLTQPAVSHAITALEQELEIPLLQRNKIPVVTTLAGQKILSHARGILSGVEHIHQIAMATRGVTAGTLKIGSIPSASARLLPRPLRLFQDKYPSVTIRVFEGSDEEVEVWIRERVVDLGIIALPQDHCEFEPLEEDAWVAVVPPKHRFVKDQNLSLKQIASEPFIMSDGGCKPSVIALFARSNLSPQVKFQVRDITTLLAMVEEGLGVSIIPALSLPVTRTWQNVRVVPLQPAVHRRLALVAPDFSQLSPVAKLFLGHMKQSQKN